MPYSIVHLCLLSLGVFSFPTARFLTSIDGGVRISFKNLSQTTDSRLLVFLRFYLVAETLPHSTSLLCFYTAIRINSTLTESHAVEVTLATYCRPLY